MYYDVATRLAVSTAGSSERYFSQAIELGEANAVYVSSVLFTLSGGSLNVTLQEGNDLDNWADVTVAGGTIAFTSDGYGTMKLGGLAARYVRLKYTMFTATHRAVLSAGVNTARL